MFLPTRCPTPYPTEERDGHGFVDWLVSSEEARIKWLQNLCEAERHGAIKFARLLKFAAGDATFPHWLRTELHRMQQQEAHHYALVKGVLAARGLPEVRRASKPEKVSEMFLAEQRAVMRFRTMLTRAEELEGDVYNIAHVILPDEAYHVIICEELMLKWADVQI